MARKSQRLSSGTTPNAATHKRVASTTATPDVDAKKARTKKATPTKSQYFEDGGVNDEKVEASGSEDLSSAPEDDPSEFGSVADNDADMDEQDDNDDEYDSEEASASRKKASTARGKEIWRENSKTGLGPGTQVIIKKPKARPAGKTPYSDDTLHQNTLLFLTELKVNNNREWLKMHDPDFRQSEKDWFSFVEKLTEKLATIDETVPELPVKDTIFRIYRDVRFSKDPTPYKPFFSAAWSRTGRKGPYAHYYIQVAPKGETFVGGGLWHPEAAPTAAMRRAIDRHSDRLKCVLLEDGMRKEFLKGAPRDAQKVVKAFVTTNKENALKTRPKGFDADHADIDLLRLRNYTIGRKMSDDEILGSGGLDRVAELFGHMQPFITYLNSVVMPDEDASDSEDDENDDEDDEEESSNNSDEDEA